jgi:hypothetical protein
LEQVVADPIRARSASDELTSGLLGDRYAEGILVATIAAPRTALELVHRLKIPTAACYRRLAALCDAGLLAVEGCREGPRGRTTKVYRALVRRITYDLSEGGTLLVIQFTDGERRRIAVPSARAGDFAGSP